MMQTPYAPADSLATKVMRKLTPLRRRRMLSFDIDRPVVSFTFDDCPKSAVTHGLVPLERHGWRGTVYLASKLFGTTNHHGLHMDAHDAQAVHRSGHEIGGHSYSHIDGNLTPLAEFITDVEMNQSVLSELGLPACQTFAYPYGEVTPALKFSLERRFAGLRGITPRHMVGRVDLNQISSTPVFSGPDFTRAMEQITQLEKQPAWLTLFMHDVCDSPSEWGCTPTEMQEIISAVKNIGATVLPVAEAIDYLKGTHT